MTPNRVAIVLWLGGAIFGVLVWWIFPVSQKERTELLTPNEHTVVSAGKEIYGKECASCHGVNLEGQAEWKSRDSEGYLPAPPHDETGHTWHHKDSVLFELTKFGLGKMSGLADYKTRMPAYENALSDEGIIAVLSYIKSTWPAEIQRRHDQLNNSAIGKSQ